HEMGAIVRRVGWRRLVRPNSEPLATVGELEARRVGDCELLASFEIEQLEATSWRGGTLRTGRGVRVVRRSGTPPGSPGSVARPAASRRTAWRIHVVADPMRVVGELRV